MKKAKKVLVDTCFLPRWKATGCKLSSVQTDIEIPTGAAFLKLYFTEVGDDVTVR